MCVLNAISCPSGRQGMWELEDLELEDGDWARQYKGGGGKD